MREFDVDELDWPAQNPDLNPIEHLWDELEWRLMARPSHPISVCDLTNVPLEEWSKMPINTNVVLVANVSFKRTNLLSERSEQNHFQN